MFQVGDYPELDPFRENEFKQVKLQQVETSAANVWNLVVLNVWRF